MFKADATFYENLGKPKKILILDLGFLGDSIQLLPAMWKIRQAFPEVQLEVMVADHIKSIMEVAPWIDAVYGYPRFPKGPKFYQDFGRVKWLRRQKYDAVINFTSSDRTSLLTWASGAKLRLGRRRDPSDKKAPIFWPLCYTHAVTVPKHQTPVYDQYAKCLEAAGFPETPAEFHVEIPSETAAIVRGKIDSDKPFIHVSPFTTEDFREIQFETLADAMSEVADAFPQINWVVSCAPNDRECARLEDFTRRLKFKPHRVFAGDLSLIELAALLAQSSGHVGGDSGALHIAKMFNLPTVVWFRECPKVRQWMPQGDEHSVLIGQTTPMGLAGISRKDLAEALTKRCKAILKDK